MVINYQRSNIVSATDYNSMVVRINAVFGTGGINPTTLAVDGSFGYGGMSINAPVSNLRTNIISGEVVDNIDWLRLRNAYADCAGHQGTVLTDPIPIVTNIEDLDIISAGASSSDTTSNFWFLDPDKTINEDWIITNRNNVDVANTAISTIAGATNSRVSAWGGAVPPAQIKHEFTITFSSTDQARYFFNTGGQIRINASRTGGTGGNTQNTIWSNLVSANSPFIFDRSHYYSLTSSFTVLRTVFSSGVYSTNNWEITVKRNDSPGINGANGRVLQFRSTFTDGHTGSTDFVDGTFTSTIQERRSVVIFNNILQPVYALVGGL